MCIQILGVLRGGGSGEVEKLSSLRETLLQASTMHNCENVEWHAATVAYMDFQQAPFLG